MDFFYELLDTYEVEKNKGIPIGNLLSQYFANMYLGVLDHEIKDNLQIKGYIRYMADWGIFKKQQSSASTFYSLAKFSKIPWITS